MPAQFVIGHGEVVDPLLGLIELTLHVGGGTVELFEQLALSCDKTLLFHAEAFEMLLLALDFLLLMAELDELLLSGLDLEVHIFQRG